MMLLCGFCDTMISLRLGRWVERISVGVVAGWGGAVAGGAVFGAPAGGVGDGAEQSSGEGRDVGVALLGHFPQDWPGPAVRFLGCRTRGPAGWAVVGVAAQDGQDVGATVAAVVGEVLPGPFPADEDASAVVAEVAQFPVVSRTAVLREHGRGHRLAPSTC